MVFHCRIHISQNRYFKSSHLFYAANTYSQYQVAVKLLGSFRLTAGKRHLHRYCIFTELCPETVLQSLRHSCTSELTRQGIALCFVTLTCVRGDSISVSLSLLPMSTDSIFSPESESSVWSLRIFRLWRNLSC